MAVRDTQNNYSLTIDMQFLGYSRFLIKIELLNWMNLTIAIWYIF
jgi:hypothetical protein